MVKTTHSGKPPLAAMIALLALAFAAHFRTPMPGDLWIARHVQRSDASFPMNIAHFGNWLGEAVPIGMVALLIALGFAFNRFWFEAGFVIVAFAAKALNGGLKSMVNAPRPAAALVRVTEHARGSGFPSGHVMGVALVLGAAVLMLSRRAPRWGASAWAMASLGIAVTAFGRVYTGAHWPSQTLGGLLAAIVLLGLLDRAAPVVSRVRRSSRRAPTIVPNARGVR